jgi:hypothetical protein
MHLGGLIVDIFIAWLAAMAANLAWEHRQLLAPWLDRVFDWLNLFGVLIAEMGPRLVFLLAEV